MPSFHLVSLFPEFFYSPLHTGLMKRAIDTGLARFSYHNPRDFGHGIHRHVDDRPFGGGPGMLMQVEPVAKALRSIEKPGKIVLLSPGGRQFDQKFARELAGEEDISLICGRYEGLDHRLLDLFPVREISLCPAVLNGGETAALAIIEAVCRLVPGFMGKEESAQSESFSNGLLEYPQYTRPETFENISVPPVLLSGNHAEIEKWRREKALEHTLAVNPALLSEVKLNSADAASLAKTPRKQLGPNLCFCLSHFPVWIEKGKSGCSSLTNLDIHDIARISRCYNLGPFFVLHPHEGQRQLLQSIIEHWQKREEGHEDRKKALSLVLSIRDYADVEAFCQTYYGRNPEWLLTSASWPEKGKECVSVEEARKMCSQGPVIMCLGTARGLDVKSIPVKFQRLAPIRFLDENHLPVRAAAAIVADRIFGDFY